LVRDGFTVYEPVHDRLLSARAELHEHIVHGFEKAAVANKFQAKAMPAFIAVRPFAESDDMVRAKRIDNG
jgi:hypothetical protein